MTPIPTPILDDLLSALGIAPRTATPVNGGYLNQKWKIDAADGQSYLLKQFSTVRYSSSNLNRIEAALQRQKYLYACGVCCPRVYDSNGTILRRIRSEPYGEITYMVMSYEAGSMPTPDTVSAAQMTSLGEQCGHMHHALSVLDPTTDHHYPLTSADAVCRLAGHMEKLSGFDDYQIPPGLDAILSTLDIRFFDRMPRQLCHEDFSGDNLLFRGNTAVILDFDRGQYSFPLHDVGRALLSLAFDGVQLRLPLVRAFADGYRRYVPLSDDDLADALRITFACEFPWWVHPDYETMDNPKIRRFVNEMYYLIRVWENLPTIVQGA